MPIAAQIAVEIVADEEEDIGLAGGVGRNGCCEEDRQSGNEGKETKSHAAHGSNSGSRGNLGEGQAEEADFGLPPEPGRDRVAIG
jgi:hypothetical protein